MGEPVAVTEPDQGLPDQRHGPEVAEYSPRIVGSQPAAVGRPGFRYPDHRAHGCTSTVGPPGFAPMIVEVRHPWAIREAVAR